MSSTGVCWNLWSHCSVSALTLDYWHTSNWKLYPNRIVFDILIRDENPTFFYRRVCLECWMWLRNTQEIRVEGSLITQEQVSHGDQLTKSSSLRAMDHKYSPLGQMLKCSRHQSRWFFDHKNPPLVLKWMLQRKNKKNGNLDHTREMLPRWNYTIIIL